MRIVLSNFMHRSSSLVIVIALLFSILPLPSSASETEQQNLDPVENISEEQAAVTESPPSETIQNSGITDVPQTPTQLAETVEADGATTESIEQIQTEMDSILCTYLGVSILSKEQITDIVTNMAWEDIQSALTELNALEPSISALTTEELVELEASYAGTETIVYFYETLQAATSPSTFAATSGTHTPVTGVTVSVSGATDNSMSNGVITVTAKGSAGFLGIGASAKTATITISNSSTSTATVAFDWTASSMNQLTIDGTVYTSASGSFSKVLEADATVNITIVTGKNATTNTLVMSNFVWTEAASASNVTFTYDNTLGNVTVEGAAVADQETKEIDVSGATLVATPVSGASFLGWMDVSDNKRLSSDSTYKLEPALDMTVKAVFVNSASCPWFLVNNSLLFDDLNSAASTAGSGGTVVLMNNGTLQSGTYTIPAGVTLLIPFDAANTLYTSVPGYTGSYSKPTAYRTLTMAEGANIVVNGAMSLSAKHRYGTASANGTSAPSGACSFVKMSEGSNITVNSGGALYAWGFITGASNESRGTVTINSGGTVCEYFQFQDYRGGSQTMGMKNKVFPLSQFYIQNVEVPMTVYAGATETCYATVSVSLLGEVGMPVVFIGDSSALFNLSDGYLVKEYKDGRLVVDVQGTLDISSSTIKVGSLYSLKTSDYVLPVNGYFSVTILSGSTLNITQDLALLPGLELTIDEGATCVLGSGKSLYIYDIDQWGNYCSSSDFKWKGVAYAPGGASDTSFGDATLIVNGTVDASAGNIYTTAGTVVAEGSEVTDWSNGGANVYSTGNGRVTVTPTPNTNTYQLRQTADTYDLIPVTSAKLKNADGSFTETANTTAGTETYIYHKEHGFWYVGEHTVTSEVTEPTCTEKGYTTHSCPCGYEARDTYTEATGHSGMDPVIENIVHPTANAVGSYDSVVYCSVCHEEVSRDTETIYIKLAAIEASADAEVELRLKCFVPSELVENGAYATVTKVTKWDSGDEKESEKITLSELTPDAAGRYVLSTGIASGEMTCPVTVQFCSGDNVELNVLDYADTTISTDVTRTVLDYAKRILDVSTNANQIAIVKSLVTYGGYAQIFFGVDSKNPAYNILGEDAPSLDGAEVTDSYTTSGSSIGIGLSSRQAYLDSAIYLRSYFTLEDGYSIDDYTFTLTYTENHQEKTKPLAAVYETVTRSGETIERYQVDITDIPAAYLDYMYKITVTHTGTGETYVVSTSVNAFLKDLIASEASTEAQRNAAKAMYLYNQSANTFFGK